MAKTSRKVERLCNPRKAKALLYAGRTITKRGSRFYFMDEARGARKSKRKEATEA